MWVFFVVYFVCGFCFHSDLGSYSHHLHLIFTLATMFEVKNIIFNGYTRGLLPREGLLLLHI